MVCDCRALGVWVFRLLKFCACVFARSPDEAVLGVLKMCVDSHYLVDDICAADVFWFENVPIT